MGPAAVAARLLLAVVLLVAAVGKWRDPAWPAAARAFGVPSWLAGTVPLAEAVIGGALALQLRAGAWGALALLGAFSALVAHHLARGSHPPCACFGARSSAPIGSRTLARNGVLLLVALVAATGG